MTALQLTGDLLATHGDQQIAALSDESRDQRDQQDDFADHHPAWPRVRNDFSSVHEHDVHEGTKTLVAALKGNRDVAVNLA